MMAEERSGTPAQMESIGAMLPMSVLIRTLNEADRIAATIRSALPLGAERCRDFARRVL